MSKVGVCRLPDGRVHVVKPSRWGIATVRDGGNTYLCIRDRMGLASWLETRLTPETLAEYRRVDMIPIDLAIEWEALKFTQCRGWRPDLPDSERNRIAMEWCRAKTLGGLNEQQAIELIVSKDATPWSTVEIMDESELPANRNWRNAWRRSANGGPIWIDDTAAEQLMWEQFNGARA